MLLCITLFFISANSVGQQFSIPTIGNISEVHHNVVVFPDHYQTIGTGYDSLNGEITHPLFVKGYNLNGELIYNKQYHQAQSVMMSWGDNNVLLNDSVSICVGRQTIENVDEEFACFIWLNQYGDTIQTRLYTSPFYNDETGDDNWFKPTALALSDDCEFLYTSIQVSEDSQNNFLIKKLTAWGDEVWTYINPLGNGSGCYALDYYNDQVWFIRSSSTKRLLSLNDEFGSVEYDILIEESSPELNRTDDLIVDVSGVVSASRFPGDPGYEKPAIFKFNLDGSYQWSYIPEVEFGLYQDNEHVLKSADGGYVNCSRYYAEEFIPQYNFNQRLWLWKVDSNGNFLWQRFYEYLSFDSGYYNLYNIAHDMKATADGGFIMAGETTSNCTDYPECDNFIQQGWLLKVDGCGCLVPGCDENCIVGVDDSGRHPELVSGSLFLVGPNPCTDFINIYLNKISNVQLSILNIQVHDISGNLIKSFNLKHDDTTYMIDTTSLASGEYVMSLVSEGNLLQTERIVVVK